MGKIYSNSIDKSFGGSVFYYSNKNLNEYLKKKKDKKQLSDNGFVMLNYPVEAAIKKIEKLYSGNIWIFPPKMFQGYITQSGYKDKKEIVSHYGKVIKKFKCHNGNMYLYKTRVLNNYLKVYVFTNKDRKIIKEIWIAED